MLTHSGGKKLHQDFDTCFGVYMQELSRSGSSCAVLVSRQPKATKEELITLAKLSQCTFHVQCDTGDSGALQTVMSWTHEHLPAIGSAAHAAGALGYDTFADVTEEQFWSVCQPKVRLYLA